MITAFLPFFSKFSTTFCKRLMVEIFASLIPNRLSPFLSNSTGISEAQITGLFFSIGITTARIVLSDFVIVISGSISIAGLILGWLKK